MSFHQAAHRHISGLDGLRAIAVGCVLLAHNFEFGAAGALVAAAFFASNYVQDKSWYTGHFWSLSAEEHFYLFWAPMLALLGFRRSQVAVIVIIVLTVITRPLLLSHIWQQIIFIPMVASLPWLCVLLPLRIAMVLAVAGISFRFLEEPLLRKAHAWSKLILTGRELQPS